MADNSNELLIGNSIEPPGPGFDGYSEELLDRDNMAIYTSSKDAIINNIGEPNFQELWKTLKQDIQFQSDDRQRIFSEQTLDKISEIYDFEFSINISLETKYEINEFYKFLEFLEFDNIEFISAVWVFVKPVNLMRFNIKEFCEKNEMKIIKEIEEQLDTHPQTELITSFLRTYYKEKMIEWFIQKSKRSRIDITIKIFEREGLTNA